MTIGQTVCPYCSNHCSLVKDSIFFSCAKCNNPLLAISRPDPLAPPDVYPADLLDFQVNELIGQGGMGRVFKGIDKKTGSIVAIKFPSKELIYSEIEKERFSNEINTLKLLNSPYIVRFFTSGVVAGFPFFVMEYVSGKNLGVAIQMAKQRGSAFPFDVVLGWFNQFCQALQSLHLHGIIHRDLKPQNIIITENGGLKIVDLGISKNLSNDSKNTITSLGGAGTFDYMAPEQLLGINNDNKSDIYSGGILFYEVLTSYLPLGNVKKPSVINETVPSWFDDIVFGMMERDPNARPTILEIFKKLQDFIPVSSTSPLSLPPPPTISILFYIKIWVPIVLFFICSYIFAKSEFWEVSNHALEYGKSFGDNNFFISGYLTFIPLIFLGCCFGIIYFWIFLPLNECFLSQVLENGKGTENDNQNKPRKHPSGLIVMGFGLLFLGLQYFWHIDLAESHYSLLGEDAGKRGKFDSALYWYKAAVDRNPNYPIGHLGLALAHYQKGEFGEAHREASRAIELNSKIAEAFNVRGNVYLKQQGWAEAITDFTKAIELDPKHALAYNNREDAYKSLGKTKEAEADFAKAKSLGGKKATPVANKKEVAAGIEIEMVLIPAGKFMMGSPAYEKGRNYDETQHEVTLTKPFYMGKYEVTQEEWESVMGKNPSFSKGAKLPVTDVSWEDCQEFIKKLNASTKGGYRLPYEAEFEYACRAGTTTAYSYGNSLTKSDAAIDGDSIKAVGGYKPNAFGLYDMHGNVWEWCEDGYANYPAGAITDPKGPGIGTSRVLRGGSFVSDVSVARSSTRYNLVNPTDRSYLIGLRLARTGDIAPTVIKPDPSGIIPVTGNLLVAPFTEAKAKEVQIVVAKILQKEVEEKADLGKGLKLDLVLIPAGKFNMGSPINEMRRYDEEKQHEVTLTQPFYMGKYEVTQEQWKSVMGNNPSNIKGEKLPVTDVSWEDCQDFIKKLNAKSSGGYRLPTEAEWEYACRAGTNTAYSFGDRITNSDANFTDKSPNDVGGYKPNIFGLYDMHGNVREWCEDWYGDYPEGATTDPKGPGTGTCRVIRGGSFCSFEWGVRSACRQVLSPNDRMADGFRLARTP